MVETIGKATSECRGTIGQPNGGGGGGVSGKEPSPSAPLTNQNHVLVTGAQIILAVRSSPADIVSPFSLFQSKR